MTTDVSEERNVARVRLWLACYFTVGGVALAPFHFAMLHGAEAATPVLLTSGAVAIALILIGLLLVSRIICQGWSPGLRRAGGWSFGTTGAASGVVAVATMSGAEGAGSADAWLMAFAVHGMAGVAWFLTSAVASPELASPVEAAEGVDA